MSSNLNSVFDNYDRNDLEAAKSTLKTFLEETFSLSIAELTFEAHKASKNSINGFITCEDGEEYFFKTTENYHELKNEYDSIERLLETGYPTLKPLYSSLKEGSHILLFEKKISPLLFDLLHSIENGSEEDTDAIIEISKHFNKNIFSMYQNSLQEISAREHQVAPIHKLLFKRLAGGRFQDYYAKSDVLLFDERIPYDLFSDYEWKINGTSYPSLKSMQEEARALLDPFLVSTASIIGHGDGHAGNIFVEGSGMEQEFTLFDPAFAGRHSPFLDMAKPLFHDTFAKWMYFSDEVHKEVVLEWSIEGNTITVEHDFKPSDIRKQLFQSKIEHIVKPTVDLLREKEILPLSWSSYLKSALFCCALLTVNLTDREKYNDAMSMLGFSIAVQMGGWGTGGEKGMLDGALKGM